MFGNSPPHITTRAFRIIRPTFGVGRPGACDRVPRTRTPAILGGTQGKSCDSQRFAWCPSNPRTHDTGAVLRPQAPGPALPASGPVGLEEAWPGAALHALPFRMKARTHQGEAGRTDRVHLRTRSARFGRRGPLCPRPTSGPSENRKDKQAPHPRGRRALRSMGSAGGLATGLFSPPRSGAVKRGAASVATPGSASGN